MCFCSSLKCSAVWGAGGVPLALLPEWGSGKNGSFCSTAFCSTASGHSASTAGSCRNILVHCWSHHIQQRHQDNGFISPILIWLSFCSCRCTHLNRLSRKIDLLCVGRKGKCPRVCRDDLQFSPAEAERMRLWAVPPPSMLPLFKMKRKPRKGKTTRMEMCLAVSALQFYS